MSAGPIGAALDRDLADLGEVLDEQNTRALAEMARKLAEVLDGDPGLVVAAVSRELRCCLGALGLGGAGEPADDEVAALLGRMSAPVRDEPPAGAGDVRRGRGRAGGGDGPPADALAAKRGRRGAGG